MSNPHRSQIHLCLSEAEINIRKQRYAKAEAALTHALSLDPECAEALLQRSKCYTLMGKTEQAIEDAAEVIDSRPDSVQGYFARAEALFFAGEFELALLDYYTCVEMRPEVDAHHHGVKKCTAAIRKAMCFSAKDANYMQALLEAGAVVECNLIPGLAAEELQARESAARREARQSLASAVAGTVISTVSGSNGVAGVTAASALDASGASAQPVDSSDLASQIGNPFAAAVSSAENQAIGYRDKLLRSVGAAPPLLLRVWEPEIAIPPEPSEADESTPGWGLQPPLHQQWPAGPGDVPGRGIPPRAERPKPVSSEQSRPPTRPKTHRARAEATADTPPASILQQDKQFLRNLQGLPGVARLVKDGIDYLSQRQNYWSQQQLQTGARRPASAGAPPRSERAQSAGTRIRAAAGSNISRIGDVGTRRIQAQALRDPERAGDVRRPKSAGAAPGGRSRASAANSAPGRPERVDSRARSAGAGQQGTGRALGHAPGQAPGRAPARTPGRSVSSGVSRPSGQLGSSGSASRLPAMRQAGDAFTVRGAGPSGRAAGVPPRSHPAQPGSRPVSGPGRASAPRSRSQKAPGARTKSPAGQRSRSASRTGKRTKASSISKTLTLLRDALATYKHEEVVSLADTLCQALPSELSSADDVRVARVVCEALVAKSSALANLGRGEDSVRTAQRCLRLAGRLEDATMDGVIGRRGRGEAEGDVSAGDEDSAQPAGWPDMHLLAPFVQGMPAERFAALRQLGKAYFGAHAVTPAIDVFKALVGACSANSYVHADTLLCLARCYFEQRDYSHAASYAKNAARGYGRVACLRAGLGASEVVGDEHEDWAVQVSNAVPAEVPPEMRALQVYPEPTARESYCFMLCLRGRALLGHADGLESTLGDLTQRERDDPVQRAVAVLEAALWHAKRWRDASAMKKATQLLEAAKRYGS